MSSRGSRFLGVVMAAAGLAGAGYGQSFPTLFGAVESYFLASPKHKGFANQLEWAELNLRLSDKYKFTGSYILFPGGHSFDELYFEDDQKNFSFRAGRMRTAFGFNDWADLFYNGFNQSPLIRQIPVVSGNLNLGRQDSGLEFTGHIGSVQVQAAAFDDHLNRDQIEPNNFKHASVRVQQAVGPLILGGDFLTSDAGDEKIYGLDVRFTEPQWVVRGEGFWGQGAFPSSGAYLDAGYRLPKFFRTQLVARFDSIKPWGEALQTLTTVGAREIVNQYLSVNLNYSFGSLSSRADLAGGQYGGAVGLPSVGYTGWSVRTMFQYRF